MKHLNLFFILILFLSLGTTAWGQTLLNENFDYGGSDNSDIVAASSNAWARHSGTQGPAYVAAGLSYTGYASSGVGGACSHLYGSSGTNDGDVNRALSSSVTTTSDVYISFLVNLTEAKETADYFFHVGPTPIGTNFRGRIFARTNTTGWSLSLSKSSETALVDNTILNFNQTYLIVLKYSFNTTAADDDQVKLYVYDTGIPASEPGSPLVTIGPTGSGTGSDPINIGTVAIRQGSNTPTGKTDGIRVGLTWAAILPPSGGGPILNVTPATLTGFTYFQGSGPSGEQSFSISGSDLTNNISITAPANYEISTGTGGSFVHTSPITLTQSGGTVNSTPIYVRLKAGLSAGNYNGELITASSVGATDKTVTCSGSVVTIGEPSNHVTSFASAVGAPPQTAIVLTWVDATGTQIPHGYLIKGSATSFASITDPVDGTPVSDGTLIKNILPGVQTHTFTGLTANTPYYFKIYPYTNSGAAINYKIDGTIPQTTTTTNNYPALPITENFDYATGTLTAVSSGTWVNHSGTSNYIPVVSGSLIYTNYIPSGIGNSVSMLTTGEDVNRQFIQKTTGDVYASFLVNFSAAQANGEYFFHLREAPSGSFYGRVFARLSAGEVQFGISKFSAAVNATWGTATYPLNTTHLVVLKYSIVDGTTNDMVYLFVNPTLGTSEPTPTLTITNSADLALGDAPNIGAVCLRQGAAGDASTQIIDGIMVATSWAEISPPSTTPTITVGSITGFGNVVINTTSDEKSYTVSGINLTGDISIVPPAGFEISTGTGGSFSPTNPIVLTPTGGTVSSTTIYVRFKPTLVQVYSGNITHNSTGATEKTVAVSGTGISGLALEPTIQASNVNFTNVGSGSMTVNWTIGNGANRIVLARSGSAVNSDPTDGSSYTANAAFGSGSQIGTGNYVVYSGSGNSVTVTGLSSTTTYHFAVYEYNGSAGTQNYLMSPATGSQITTAPEATISYTTVASEYTQDFNGLPNTGSFTYIGLAARHLAATPVFAVGMPGWYFAKNTGSGGTDLFHVETGSGTGGACKSYGIALTNPVEERALGALGSGTYAPILGALITNSTGGELNKFTITFTGEQWRRGTGAANTLTFKYKVGAIAINEAEGFITVSGLNFVAPVTTGSGVALDGNDPANRTAGITATVRGLTWPNGAVLAIRWDKVDETGSDDGLAIDDLTFSAVVEPPISYYYKGTGNLHEVASWGTGTDGSGTPPTDFISDIQIFNIRNTSSVSTSAAWTVSGAGSKIVVGDGINPLALTVSIGSAITGTVNVSANADVILQDISLPSFGSLASTSTIDYAQSGTVAVTNTASYGNLKLTGGTKTFPSGNTNVSGNVVVDGVSDFTGLGTLVLNGNLTLQNGTTMITGMSLTCNGSSVQTIRGNGTNILFFRLTQGNSAGVILSTTGGSSNFLVTGKSGGNLVLGGNHITTLSNYISVDTATAVSRTTGYIIGNFRKRFDIGSAVAHTFEIGDASNYTPVTVTFAAVLNGGYITASTTAGDHSAIGTSGIHENKSVNRFWTLLNGGIVFDNYSATFNFVSGDVDPGANTDNFIVKRYNSGWFTPTTGLRTATSTEATGIVGFGDFAIGESSSALIFQVANSWNMVSVPLTVPNYSKSVLFPTAISNAFAYSAGYQPKDILENGVGYWIKFGSQQDISMEGIARTSDSVAVALGWNMIGSISTQIGTANVTPSSGIIISSQFFGYAGGYSPAATINPGKAYWVKVSGAGKLYFNSGSLSKESVSEVKTLDNLNSITITDAAGSSQTLYFGADIDGTFSVDYYELPPTAPEGVMDVRYNSQRMVEVHPRVIEKSQAYPITISSAVFPLTISWNITNGNSAVYQLSEGKNTTTLTASGSIKITDENIQSISLKAGSAELLPTEFSLGQNYPNPFNPSTKFTIAIPKNAEVNVSVYDILGRKISDLVNGQMTAGYHTIEWNGKADAGYTVPSGIYFIKMTLNSPDSKNFSAVRKVTLLK